MSDDFTQLWNDLVNPGVPSQADADYAAVAAGADALPLDQQEAYNVAWGPDATPDAWLRARAQAISDQINGADSTAILKRGRGTRALTQAEKDAEAAQADAAAAGVPGATANPLTRDNDRSGGDGQSNSNPSGDTSSGVRGPGVSVGNPVGAALGGLLGFATGGIPGAVMGAGKYGDFSMTPGVNIGDPANSRATRDAADALAAAAANGAEADQESAPDMSAAMGQMDAQAAENESNNSSNDTNSNGGQGSDSAAGGTGGGGTGNNAGSNSGDGEGCVDPATLVLLADLSSKPAGNLQVGDVLHAMHEESGVFGSYPVSAMAIVHQPKCLLEFNHDVWITVSESHKFYSNTQQWVQVRDMHAGDKVQGLMGVLTLLAIHALAPGDVVKLTVADAHTYIAAGLVSHNKYASGGKVVAERLHGPDPKGPDDGYSALDIDEFVVRKSAAELYGDDVMAAINEGRIPVGALRRLIQQ